MIVSADPTARPPPQAGPSGLEGRSVPPHRYTSCPRCPGHAAALRRGRWLLHTCRTAQGHRPFLASTTDLSWHTPWVCCCTARRCRSRSTWRLCTGTLERVEEATRRLGLTTLSEVCPSAPAAFLLGAAQAAANDQQPPTAQREAQGALPRRAGAGRPPKRRPAPLSARRARGGRRRAGTRRTGAARGPRPGARGLPRRARMSA